MLRLAYFYQLTASERCEVRRGYRDVMSGSVRPSWNDDRDECRNSAQAMLEELITRRDWMEYAEADAICWTIGRDLATARQRH